MIVLFLDVDGVLNSEKWWDSMLPPPNHPSKWLDPACVARLDALVRETSASLVLSSSWRLLLGLDGTTEILAKLGLSVPLFDATPDLTHVMVATDRWPEIRAWLGLHPEVARWAVVDDLPLVGVPDGRLVQTNVAVGLTDEDCVRLREILVGAT